MSADAAPLRFILPLDETDDSAGLLLAEVQLMAALLKQLFRYGFACDTTFNPFFNLPPTTKPDELSLLPEPDPRPDGL